MGVCHCTHTVTGRLLHTGEVGPAMFEVVAPTYPTEGFTIDFDHVPGTDRKMTSVTELWPSGVRLSTRSATGTRDAGVFVRRDGVVNAAGWPHDTGNQFAGAGPVTSPPGFNVVANFDVPVYGAAVDVASAAGVTVTMIARNAAGEEIGVVMSAPVSQPSQLTGPLTLAAEEPIASLEWWPSATNAGVYIDNLRLDLTATPEPSSVAILGGVACAGLLARRRGAS